MPRRAKISEPASKKAITEWAKGYAMPNVEDFFADIGEKLAEAIAKDFGQVIAQNDKNDIMVIPGDEPGFLTIYFGGEESNITPHVLELSISIGEIAKDVVDGIGGDQVIALEELQEWRDHFKRAVHLFDNKIASASKK